jgi:adenylylsulfate kinase-like enzyme
MNKAIDKTGLSNLYEKPKNSDLEIDTSRENINSIVNKIVNKIL